MANDSFLARWARLKRAAQAATPAPPLPPKPVLPPLESLSLESDFSGFLHPDVENAVRQVALKKLFHDPHFNAMDGLDVYIDDYSIADPIPADLLKELLQAQSLPPESPEEEEREPPITMAGASEPLPSGAEAENPDAGSSSAAPSAPSENSAS